MCFRLNNRGHDRMVVRVISSNIISV